MYQCNLHQCEENYQNHNSEKQTLASCMLYSIVFKAVNARGSSALQTQNTVYDFNQGAALPNNQWQIELGG